MNLHVFRIHGSALEYKFETPELAVAAVEALVQASRNLAYHVDMQSLLYEIQPGFGVNLYEVSGWELSTK